MKYKKSLCILLAGLLCVTAVSCGNGKTAGSPTGTVPTGTSAQGDPTVPTDAPVPGTATLYADIKDPAAKAISPLLYGIFLEDINHAVDGGMYTELIKNRSFEYSSEASDKNMHGWKTNRS